ncbi:MAG: aromatic ring-hydroxylating dioxygenase subunit alpha [Nannocystaceae bacterium]|nr:aromatic ring-hydroxylating dioxygenase subunit alpha [Nannocystaceae bacterium]
MHDLSGHAPSPPPSFEHAKNRRQKARAAGLDPNYWYAVTQSSKLRAGEHTEVKFLGRSIAVFRGQDGRLRAVENRCAHRHVALTAGEVVGCKLVCPYHGWAYDGDGNAEIPHDLFGHKQPNIRIESVPVRERYGLVFVFPGDPALATTRDIPSIPELEGPRPWPHAFVQFDCPGHHSMLLENVSDFTHGFLHRKYQPFSGTDLLRCETVGERVEVEYRSRIAAGRLQDWFIDRSESGCDHMLACYDYPYHWSNTDDRIKHFLFTLPWDEGHNRHIFIFYLRPDVIRVPMLGWKLPYWLVSRMMRAQRVLTLQPLLGQDVWVIEREQKGWSQFWDRPAPELSPVVKAFQDLTIRKWQEYLDGRGRTAEAACGNVVSAKELVR